MPNLLREAAGPESEALARTGAASDHRVHAIPDAATLATFSGEPRHSWRAAWPLPSPDRGGEAFGVQADS